MKTKQCIWCRRTEEQASFKNLAHTIPKSLGGKDICENVCDDCNSYFGNYQNGNPPIESVIKETFNISRAVYLQMEGEIGKNKAMAKFSSSFFDFKLTPTKNTLKLKTKYQFHKGFQETLARQIKKGIYKMFLEEIERQEGDGLNPKYDFIREFARYDLGDYPVFYFERNYGIIFMSTDWAVSPKIFLASDQKFGYLVSTPDFFEFEFFGHVFGIVTSRNWESVFDDYKLKSFEAKKKIFKSVKQVKQFNDIDLALSVLDD